MHFESGVGHIGGNLSSLDAMLIVFHEYLSGEDKFVLSKGHSAGALYTILWSLGRLRNEDLKLVERGADYDLVRFRKIEEDTSESDAY